MTRKFLSITARCCPRLLYEVMTGRNWIRPYPKQDPRIESGFCKHDPSRQDKRTLSRVSNGSRNAARSPRTPAGIGQRRIFIEGCERQALFPLPAIYCTRYSYDVAPGGQRFPVSAPCECPPGGGSAVFV